MIFGSISYLNLLPFQVYMKRYFPATQFQQMLRWRRAVPSVINREFLKGRVHAAFISSITSAGCRCTDLGIVADGAVYSVFLLPGKPEEDQESASSNMLAEILELEGKVVIGDKALQYYLDGGEGIDLAREWKHRTGLPFVFARLCFNRQGAKMRQVANHFGRRQWRIPYYLLRREAERRGITATELSWYLEHIHYRIGWKEQRALKRFVRESQRLKRTYSRNG